MARMALPMVVPPGSRVTKTGHCGDSSAAASRRICVDLPLPSGPSKVMKRDTVITLSSYTLISIVIIAILYYCHSLFAEDSHTAIRFAPIAVADEVGSTRELMLLAADGRGTWR